MTHGDADSPSLGRWFRGIELLCNAAGVGKREHGVGHDMAFARIFDHIQYVIFGALVAQQDEWAPIEDWAQFAPIVRFLERTKGLREEHGVLAEDRIQAKLVQAPFKIIVLNQIGAACRDHEIGFLIDIQTASICSAEEDASESAVLAKLPQHFANDPVVVRLEPVFQSAPQGIAEERFRQELVKFQIGVIVLWV